MPSKKKKIFGRTLQEAREIHTAIRPLALRLFEVQIGPDRQSPPDQKLQILEQLCNSERPVSIGDLVDIAGEPKSSEKDSAESKRRTISEQLRRLRKEGLPFDPAWFKKAGLPELCLNYCRKQRTSFQFFDFFDTQSKEQIERLVAKGLKKLEEKHPEPVLKRLNEFLADFEEKITRVLYDLWNSYLARLHAAGPFPQGVPSETAQLDKEVLEKLRLQASASHLGLHGVYYKDRISLCWNLMWFPHLDLKQLQAPYLERSAIPTNEVAKKCYGGPVLLTELVKRENAIILLGEPGSGKTYTSAQLAVACARDQLLRGFFPIYASLSRFGKHKRIKGLCREAIDVVLAVDALHYTRDLYDIIVRSRSRIFYVFDGFDEVLGKQKTNLISQLRSLCRDNLHKVMITCRRFGYNDEFARVPAFSLTPLTDSQIVQYLQYFLGVNAEITFYSQIARDPLSRTIAGQPFILSMMALLLSIDKDRQLPPSAPRLLDAFIGALPLHKAMESRQQAAAAFHAQKDLCLEIIAYDTIQKLDEITGYTYENAGDALCDKNLTFPLDKLLEQAYRDRFLQRGGYLHPKDTIEFSHELFRAIFAARLIRTFISGKTEDEKEKAFVQMASRARWETTLFLLFGLLDAQDRRLAVRVFKSSNPRLSILIQSAYRSIPF